MTKASGKHQCPDWDYLEIDSSMPEYESCLCSKVTSVQLIPADPRPKLSTDMTVALAPNSALVIGNRRWVNEGPGVIYLNVAEKLATANIPSTLIATEYEE